MLQEYCKFTTTYFLHLFYEFHQNQNHGEKKKKRTFNLEKMLDVLIKKNV